MMLLEIIPMASFSSSRIIDLTHVMTETMPTWNEGQDFSQVQTFFADVDGYTIHELMFKKADIGTHFDNAAHFFQWKTNGKSQIFFYFDSILFSQRSINIRYHN